MSIVSANTLFHFTSAKETLLTILRTGFRPSYSEEFGPVVDDLLIKALIPMVCFCDLPVSSLKKHIDGHEGVYEGKAFAYKGYGNYGLGMSKSWGIEKKLTPVTYFTKNSHHVRETFDALEGLLPMYDYYETEVYKKLPNKKVEEYTPGDQLLWKSFYTLKNALDAIQTNMNFMKPYQDSINGRRYYDEREWRFVVPYIEKAGYDVPAILPDRFPDKGKAQMANGMNHIVNHYMIPFKANDIKYVIVKDDSDIDYLVKGLMSLPHMYSPLDINRLVTRILTCEQIHDDF